MIVITFVCQEFVRSPSGLITRRRIQKLTLMVMVYYSTRIQIKISKVKGICGRVQEEPSANFQVCLPMDLHVDDLNSSGDEV